MRVALVFAMAAEAAPVVAALGLERAAPLDARLPIVQYAGTFRGLSVVLSESGRDEVFGVDQIGTQAATLNTYLTLRAHTPDLCINAGTAGGFVRRGLLSDAASARTRRSTRAPRRRGVDVRLTRRDGRMPRPHGRPRHARQGHGGCGGGLGLLDAGRAVPGAEGGHRPGRRRCPHEFTENLQHASNRLCDRLVALLALLAAEPHLLRGALRG